MFTSRYALIHHNVLYKSEFVGPIQPDAYKSDEALKDQGVSVATQVFPQETTDVQNIEAQTQGKLEEYRGEVGLESQARALALLMNKNGDIPKPLEGLKDTNIASLARMLSTTSIDDINAIIAEFEGRDYNTGKTQFSMNVKASDLLKQYYISDGYFGNSEARAVYDFLQYYVGHPEVQEKMQKIATSYNNGVDTTSQLRAEKSADNLNASNLTEFLATTYGNAIANAGGIKRAFDRYFKKSKNIEQFSELIFGKKMATLDELVAAFKEDPYKRAEVYRFLDQGLSLQRDLGESSFTSASLERIFGRGTASQLDKDMSSLDSPEGKKILDEKLRQYVIDAKAQIESADLSPADKQKYLQQLATLNAEDFKKSLIRFAGAGIGANIGRDATSIGVGASFATAIEGLSLNPVIGTGQSGSILGLVVRYGGEVQVGGKGANDKNNTYLGGGINAGASTAGFTYFLDGSVRTMQKITNIGGGDIDDKNTHVFSVVVGPGFQTIGYSRLDNREDKIRQYGELLKNILWDIAATKDTDLKTVLRDAMKKNGAEGRDAQINQFATELQQYMDDQGVDAQTSIETRWLIIQQFATRKTEQLLTDEASNTVDAKSFGGWSVGIGRVLGVVFPAVGLSWYDIRGELSQKNDTSTNQGVVNPENNTQIQKVPPEEIELALGIGADSALPSQLLTKEGVRFFLNARNNSTFREFQSALTQKNDKNTARSALVKYIESQKGEKVAGLPKTELLDLVKKTDNDSIVLDQINALTSGSRASREIGIQLSQKGADVPGILKKYTNQLESILKTSRETSKQLGPWGPKEFESLYSAEGFKKAIEGGKVFCPKENCFGSIAFSQVLGAARGRGSLPLPFEVYGISDVSLEQRDAVAASLRNEFKKDRPDAYKKLLDSANGALSIKGVELSVNDLDQLLIGKTVEKNGGITITPQEFTVKKALSAVDNATCFNATAWVELGKWSVKIPGEEVITHEPEVEPGNDINNRQLAQRNVGIGVSFYNRPKPKQPKEPTTEPGTTPETKDPTPDSPTTDQPPTPGGESRPPETPETPETPTPPDQPVPPSKTPPVDATTKPRATEGGKAELPTTNNSATPGNGTRPQSNTNNTNTSTPVPPSPSAAPTPPVTQEVVPPPAPTSGGRGGAAGAANYSN